MTLLQRLVRLRWIATLVIVLVCLLLGWCRHGCEVPAPPPPAPPIAPPVVVLPPVVVPALPPPVIVSEPPPPAPEPEPVAAPPVPEPPAAAQPVAEPVAPPVQSAPPGDTVRRAAIRAELIKDGYRYGGKATGPWPPHLLEEEIERRLRAEATPAK